MFPVFLLRVVSITASTITFVVDIVLPVGSVDAGIVTKFDNLSSSNGEELGDINGEEHNYLGEGDTNDMFKESVERGLDSEGDEEIVSPVIIGVGI